MQSTIEQILQKHCKNGHEFTKENTYVYPNGRKVCRTCIRQHRKEFYRRHPDREQQWYKNYYNEHKTKRDEYNRSYHKEHQKEISERHKKHHEEHPEVRRMYNENHHAELLKTYKQRDNEYRLRAFKIVSKQEHPTCPCGCNNMRYLELNYILGGHSKLVRAGKMKTGMVLYRGIALSYIDATQFNVRCRACNSVDHIEHAVGKKLWTIKYNC